jgi:N-acetylglucosamine-6-phosphate deacetylase
MRLRAHHYRTGERIDVVCDGSTISSVGPAGAGPADLENVWIAPALCDVQINGAHGKSFTVVRTVAEVHGILDVCRRHGIGELCPTLITASADDLIRGFTFLAHACTIDADIRRAVVGFHLEGPYIAAEDGPRGAHPRAHVRPPDWDEFRRFQDAAAGRIVMVTLAPESPGALTMIEKLAASGVVVALGHTAASPAQIRDAVRAGARTSTHLGNGSHALLPRHDNYLWEQMASDELWASLIVDGHHLPASVVRTMVRAKTLDRLLLTCDASPYAGSPVGKYRDWDTELEVLPEGKIVVAGTPYLAGSWAFLDTCIAKLVEMTGISLADAVDLASAQPRRLLGLPPRRLEPGQPADLMLFDHRAGRLEVHEPLVAGRDR